MNSASIIGIVNQKGGTGKTTTCVNLGIDLVHEGKRVLIADCDPQGSLTISLGYPQPDSLPVTLADLMGNVLSAIPIHPGDGVLHHEEGVDILPANIALAGMEVSLVNAMSRETTLKQVLANYSKDYDHILLDCSPSLGMLTINALTAADRRRPHCHPRPGPVPLRQRRRTAFGHRRPCQAQYQSQAENRRRAAHDGGQQNEQQQRDCVAPAQHLWAEDQGI